MKIEKSNVIKISYTDDLEYKKIKKVFKEKLTFVDPNSFSNYASNATKYIRCYKESKAKKTFTINRGSEGILDSLFRSGIKKVPIEDKTQEGANINMVANFDFRDEIQKDSFEKYINSKNNMGVLNLG